MGKKTMRVTLGTFARAGIASHLGTDIQAGVNTALAHYMRGLESGRAPLGLPPFYRDQALSGDAEVVTVDPDTRELLEREAERQGTTVDRLATHSVLSYLAELDFVEAVPRQVDAGCA